MIKINDKYLKQILAIYCISGKKAEKLSSIYMFSGACQS